MSLLTIITAVVIVGFLLWAINTLIPMQANIKRILNVVVVVILVIWLFRVFGVLDSLQAIKV